MNKVETSSAARELTGVVVTAEGFSADAVPLKKNRPGFWPKAFAGKFIAIPLPRPKKLKKEDPTPVKHALQLSDKKIFTKREAPAR